MASRNIISAFVTLRAKLVFSISIPVGLAIVAFYSATLSDGMDAKWLFRMGFTFALSALVFGRMTWLAHKHRELANRLALVEAMQQEINEEREARQAARAWRLAASGEKPRIRLVKTED